MEQPRERAASLAVLTSIPMVGQLIAGRALRDTLFLTQYDAAHLPTVMLAAAGTSLAAAVAVGRLMPRLGPRRMAVGLALANAAIFALEALLLDAAPRVVAVVAYVHISTLGALVISAFSSVVNERFDPLYAKTVVAQVGIGATLGGVLGGLVAFVLSDTPQLSTVLWGLGAAGLLVALGAWSVGESSEPRRATERVGAAATIRSEPYLQKVALTIVLLGVVGVLVDYAMKAEADATFTDSSGLLSFFAIFYMVTSFLTFVVQAGVAKPLLRKVGLGGAMSVLPLGVALTAGLGAVWTTLGTAALARGTQTVTSSSLFRSGYELLYNPLPPMRKRATKAVVDIACNRIGYGLGSVLVMAVIALAGTAEAAAPWSLWLAVVAAMTALALIRQLQDGYVEALGTSLREGAVSLGSDEVVDATTLHTLAKTAGVLDRQKILESVEALDKKRLQQDAELDKSASLSQLAGLLSDDPQQVLQTLLDESLSPRLAAHVIDLLGNDVFAKPAYGALERMQPHITGQLVDALCDARNPAAVRRRIPRLLRKNDRAVVVQGLLEALGDDEFDVRYRCAHALADIQKRNRSISVPKDVVMQTVEREVAADHALWQQQRRRDDISAEIHGEIDVLLQARDDRNLQHVFTLLSLTLDREAVILSLRALCSQDEKLRGTALEYLHNVLPDQVRDPLWPRLTERSERPPPAPERTPPDELLKTMQSIMLDRDLAK